MLFFILFWLNVYFFLLVQTIDLSLVSFPSLLVPCTFSFLSLFIAFTFSSILRPYSANFVSILITSIFNCACDRLAISSSLSCIFWNFDLFFHLGLFFFFVSGHLLYSKGRSLRYSPGRGNTSLRCGTACGGGV